MRKERLIIIVDFVSFLIDKTILETLDKIVDQIIAFCHALQSLSESSFFILVGTTFSNSKIIFDSDISKLTKSDLLSIQCDESVSPISFSLLKHEFYKYTEELHNSLFDRGTKDAGQKEVDGMDGDSVSISFLVKYPTLLSGLAKGLMILNRQAIDKGFVDNSLSRILLICSDQNQSQQYIPLMNCVFSAQKNEILIDCCQISRLESYFLQQASFLTRGLYVKIEKTEHLLFALLSLFTLDQTSRRLVKLPIKREITFNTICFCHRKQINVGFVCPICLSVFCTFIPVCSMCRTKFEFDIPKLS